MEQVANNKLMVSVYKEFKYNLGEKSLLDVLQEIKSDKYQSEINSIRYALHKGEDKTADEIKSNLIGFTTSGTFGESRTKANIVTYSQILCLDFDYIPLTEINSLVSLINGCRYTFASFISPSGEGLKVFIKVNSNAEQHTTVYNQIANFYKELSGYDFDAKCKDITRLCFVSCDTELYLNNDAITFELKEEVKPIKTEYQKEVQHTLTTDELLDKCLKFTEQKEQYYNGNRNNFIFLFSCNANKFGIYEDDTLNYCLNNFDLEEREIKATVNSTYKNQSTDFARYSNFANLQSATSLNTEAKEKSFEEYEDCLKTTPTIPQSVYDNLPPILNESCQVFKQERERDTFLTGALAILSGCLPNVSGVYSGSVIYPSLFSFILAPAASGKGALKFAKALADKYHDKTLANSMEDKKRFDENLAAYKMLKAKGKLEENQEMPIAPKFKVVYIPANTSNAKIIQHLDCNEGKGIICETEADTLGQTFKNDWGSYSDMLRKSFHHEKISVSRKTDGEFVEVDNPQLSVALSGTPKQVFNIISSAEDGLFSRFIFYVFKTDAVWLDPSPKGNPINLTDYFTTQSKQVLKMVEYYETDEMILHLTDEQWEKFNPIFSSFLEQINTFVSEDALSIVKRLGLVLYRLCMLFTAIRKYVSNDYHTEVYCSDVDFETALTLTRTYLQHSVIMFTNLPKQGEQGVFKSGSNKKQFLEALPSKFQRKEAVEIAKRFNIGERSVGSFLKSCLGKYLSQAEYGIYCKM
ncbi:DUF3987 domain-containing protein [uncultured Flavobacterium sp.]|uniref:DUF3987 domain-containing protein n=1 Tax=uncultured Flavobacterium sp. TaxID=165435 RepID=UPI0030EC7479|tara:strand:- start:72089 stop:74347 length:2259 start_codon:yes stop_codon:yes gene_type:complete